MLHKDTLVYTAQGKMPACELDVGMELFTMTSFGELIMRKVERVRSEITRAATVTYNLRGTEERSVTIGASTGVMRTCGKLIAPGNEPNRDLEGAPLAVLFRGQLKSTLYGTGLVPIKIHDFIRNCRDDFSYVHGTRESGQGACPAYAIKVHWLNEPIKMVAVRVAYSRPIAANGIVVTSDT